MADLMPWEEAQQAAAQATPAPAPAPAAPTTMMPWEEAQAAAKNYVKTPSEVDAAITGAPAASDSKPVPMVTPPANPNLDNRTQAQLEAAAAVQSNEAGKNFDYSQSPLRHLMSEDNARALVGSQLSSQDRSLAFDSAQQNAVLMGAGNWLDREVNGSKTGPGTSMETAQIPAGVSEPDYAAAAREAHPTAAAIGTGLGVVQGVAGQVPKAVAAATGGLIDFIKPVAGKLWSAGVSTVKHAPATAAGVWLEEKARGLWEGMKNEGGDDEE